MERQRIPESAEGCRAEARRLWKHLRGSDAARARAAGVARLEAFAGRGPEGVLAAREHVRRKHALAAVAEELGFASWNELVCVHRARVGRPSFHTPRMNGLVNRWFARLGMAQATRAAEGGYLLPFGRQLVVTEAEGIRALGLDPADRDWQRVGFDLAAPRERAAFERLCERRRAALALGIGPPSAERRAGPSP